jgi:hypothetical protein
MTEKCEECAEKKPGLVLEKAAIINALGAFMILVSLELLLYFGLFSTMPDFIPRYGWWLFYLDISVAALGAAAWHIYSYKTNVSCMAGMMIGMTFGMQTSMMIGIILGATNGFFIGAIVAMIVGIGAGVLAGRCCGVMGIMEGMMAGVMGGTMGPMISVMMINDHLLWFMPLFTIANIAILVGLMHMWLREVVEPAHNASKRQLDSLTFISLCIIATTALATIMIFGPKSALFGG